MVSIEDFKLIEFIEDEFDVIAARKALATKGKTVTLEQLEKRLGG